MKSVTLEEIESEFEGTNFGSNSNHLEILVEGVVHKSSGYYVGHTLDMIMIRMKLIGKNKLPTSRGRKFMRDNYNIWSKL